MQSNNRCTRRIIEAHDTAAQQQTHGAQHPARSLYLLAHPLPFIPTVDLSGIADLVKKRVSNREQKNNEDQYQKTLK